MQQLIEEGVRADLAYMDLGMSSMQVDNRERGFAYAYDAPLDMRMDPDQDLTAYEIVNTWDRRRLARMIREYGEERFADRIAGEIVRRRGRAELTTTFELNDAIAAAVPAPARFAGGHPAKRTFQAIRIAVNGELAQLDEALPLAWDVLRVGGRLARCPSTRSRTGASSGSSPRRPAAASARPTFPSASAATRRRRSSSTAARSSRRRARWRPTRDRSRPACGPPASSGRSADHARARDRNAPRTAPLHPRRISGPVRRPLPAGPRSRAAAPARSSGSAGIPDHYVVDRLLRSRGCASG